MRIAVLKETASGETRVAATPETVKKFIALGASVAVQPGAGDSASIADAAAKATRNGTRRCGNGRDMRAQSSRNLSQTRTGSPLVRLYTFPSMLPV